MHARTAIPPTVLHIAHDRHLHLTQPSHSVLHEHNRTNECQDINGHSLGNQKGMDEGKNKRTSKNRSACDIKYELLHSLLGGCLIALASPDMHTRVHADTYICVTRHMHTLTIIAQPGLAVPHYIVHCASHALILVCYC